MSQYIRFWIDGRNTSQPTSPILFLQNISAYDTSGTNIAASASIVQSANTVGQLYGTLGNVLTTTNANVYLNYNITCYVLAYYEVQFTSVVVLSKISVIMNVQDANGNPVPLFIAYVQILDYNRNILQNIPLKVLVAQTTQYFDVIYKSIPQRIPGMQLWLDANDYSTITLGPNSNYYDSNYIYFKSVLQLNDKSGNGRNAVPGNTQKQMEFYNPNGFNNLPTIYFGGQGSPNSCPLASPVPAGTFPNGMSIFIIIYNYKSCGNHFFSRLPTYSSSPIDASACPIIMVNNRRSIGNNVSNVAFTASYTPNAPTAANTLLSVTLSTTQYNEYINGNTPFTYNYSSVYGDTGTNVIIGANGGGYGDIAISEVLMYDNVLSTTNQQLIEGYLAWKWNINSSLPTNHPYYNYAPWLEFTYAPTSNLFSSSYIKGFTDISGSVIVRNNNLIITNGDLSYFSSSITTNISPIINGNVIAYDISCNNNILINGNVNINSLTIAKSFTTNTFNSTNTNLIIRGNMVVNNDVSFNSNNIVISNMTVGILKPNSSGIATSCGAGYNIVNTALSKTSSNLQNNVIIGGNIAPLLSDINYSTLIGSNILCYNNSTSIMGNITAIGAFSAANPGNKTNSTYIGAFAGTNINNPTTTYDQTNNTFIGGNTFAGNDADSQTSIGFGCTKTIASPNIMYVGTTSETVYFPNKLNIGPAPGDLGNLNVDGSVLFQGSGTVNVQDLSMNLNGATYYPGNFSVASMMNNINNSGFILNAQYTGTWIVGDYFGMMGGIQSDASSVIYMPACYIFGARAQSSNTVSGTNIYLSVLNNGIDAGNSTNQIAFNITDSSLNTYAPGPNSLTFGLKFNQADKLSVRYSTVSGGAITMSGGGTQNIRVTLFCGYSY